MAIPEVVMVEILCKAEDVSNDQREMVTAQNGLWQWVYLA